MPSLFSRSLKEIGEDAELFGTPPGRDELLLLGAVNHLYCSILHAGHGWISNVKLHEDWVHLRIVRWPKPQLLHLKGLVGAMTGSSARYMLRHWRVFTRTAYLSHGIMQRILEVRPAPLSVIQDVQTRYGELVEVVLGRSRNSAGQHVTQEAEPGFEIFANVFACPSGITGHNPTAPSMAMLRIIGSLAGGSRKPKTLSILVAELGGFGIPVDVTIAAINHLHKKERLLLWLSKNTDLDANKFVPDETATLSEHGYRYWRSILGDFEFVWNCAAEISNSDKWPEKLEEKVLEYGRLLRLLCEIELLQHAFSRLSADRVTDDVTGLSITQKILDQSARRLLYYIAWVKKTTPSAAYARDLQQLHQEIARLTQGKINELGVLAPNRATRLRQTEHNLAALSVEERREAIRTTLQSGIPTYTHIRLLLERWRSALPPGDSARAFASDLLRRLEENRYIAPLRPSAAALSLQKGRCNEIIRALDDLATAFGVVATWTARRWSV